MRPLMTAELQRLELAFRGLSDEEDEDDAISGGEEELDESDEDDEELAEEM